jgi:glutathione S-transferase
MLELYHNHTSVCAAKVRFALEEKGLSWTGRYVDIFSGEQHRPEYLKLNPLAVIPTLVHDGTPFIESNLINEYLDDTFPEVPLRPETTADRFRMRLWTKQLDDSIHGAVSILSYAITYRFFQLAKPRAEVEKLLSGIPEPERRERNRDLIDKGVESRFFVGAIGRFQVLLKDMDATLETSSWLAGPKFSLADIGYAPYITRLDKLHMSPLWDRRPRVADWYNRVRSRRAYQKAIAEWYDGAPYAKTIDETGARSWPQVKKLLESA